MERYDLRQLAVVGEQGRMLGAFLIEDVVDVLEQEAMEDVYRIAVMGGERVAGPLRGSVRRRLPWLYLNLATTILAASVVGPHESTIARLVTLAVFLPVVGGQGGIGGMQILTLVFRSMRSETCLRDVVCVC